MVNSNGMEGSIDSSNFVVVAETSVRDENDRKPEGWWYTVSCYRNKLPSMEYIGKEATRRAIMGLGAKPEPSGKYACVIENAVTGRLLEQLSAGWRCLTREQKVGQQPSKRERLPRTNTTDRILAGSHH